eukprot:TRINITY_DN369_c0_g2_i1.p1 TRINITY_DN369_c0_g2~~TRINITY_DN369_c0_g2_i1.p1  ORF type:complete len:359 (+),score=66.18 TRINITY_DN369_c0_g2_i1:35-1111(+)
MLSSLLSLSLRPTMMNVDEAMQASDCVIDANLTLEKTASKHCPKGMLNAVDDDGISNADCTKGNNDANDGDEESTDESCISEACISPPQLGPGLFPSDTTDLPKVGKLDSPSDESEDEIPSEYPVADFQAEPAAEETTEGIEQVYHPVPETLFTMNETLLIFDWDDTILPSSWIQGQGLRLDDSSVVSPCQREQLAEVARVAAETLRVAKTLGKVVLITNAERGWIELSCRKFLPTIYPLLESTKLISARTTYESVDIPSPVDWKCHAFANEIARVYGDESLECPHTRKNVISLGDSIHEREALLRACALLSNCRSKSLKFVERPCIAELCKQHALVASCFEQVAHHDGNLDMCIRCA